MTFALTLVSVPKIEARLLGIARPKFRAKFVMSKPAVVCRASLCITALSMKWNLMF
jgi:hypothetical protein